MSIINIGEKQKTKLNWLYRNILIWPYLWIIDIASVDLWLSQTSWLRNSVSQSWGKCHLDPGLCLLFCVAFWWCFHMFPIKNLKLIGCLIFLPFWQRSTKVYLWVGQSNIPTYHALPLSHLVIVVITKQRRGRPRRPGSVAKEALVEFRELIRPKVLTEVTRSTKWCRSVYAYRSLHAPKYIGMLLRS